MSAPPGSSGPHRLRPLARRIPGARRAARAVRGRLAGPTVQLPWVDGLVPRPPGGAAALRVGYVSGAAATASHLYRVEHQLDALRALGHVACWCRDDEAGAFSSALAHCQILVLFRVAWSDEIGGLVARARRAGAVVVFDIDDYVFDEDVANVQNVDGLRFLSDEELERYHEGVQRYRRSLQEADLALVTTRYLAERIDALGVTALTLPNGLSRAMLVESERARAQAPARSGVRIGYASGTRTHQRDFAACAPAIARALGEHPEATLVVVGELDVAEISELAPFGERIERRPLVPHARLPFELARFDINIAPLEVGNPYCEAKSELKWFEAAAVGVPTIASATQPFADAIEHGVTGFVASDETGWFEALSELIENRGRRSEVAAQARTVALARYGSSAREARVASIVSEALDLRARVAPARRALQRVTILMPAMIPGSGGHGVLLSLARFLADAGLSVHCQFDAPSDAYPTPQSIAERHGLADCGIAVSYAPAPFVETDVLVATYWTTVLPCIEFARNHPVPVVQLVQDYEAWFFPMGREFLGAQRALRRGQHLVCWGRWLSALIERHHGLSSDHLDYSLDHATYTPDAAAVRADDHVIFFARPDMPRRLFSLGVDALKKLEEARPSIRITMFGSDETRAIGLPARWRDVGVVTPAALVDLYRVATLGIAFSPTNPSSVPFEMMACGLPVVDVALEDSEERYGARTNLLLAEPTAEEVAETLARALDDGALRARVAVDALAFVRSFPSRDHVAAAFLEVLERVYRGSPRHVESDRST